MKKVLLSLSAFALAVASVPMFAAFEAHVINVTARIENALQVPVKEIKYGTVFPQEQLDRFFDVALSGSFMEENRVDDVRYIIRQKPKCAVTSENGTVMLDFTTATGHVIPTGGSQYEIDCGPAPVGMPAGATWGPLPSLCPYLSKHKGADGVEANEVEVAAFHTPFTVSTTSVSWAEAVGYLAKSNQDIRDQWKIDLKVPCFKGHCAQDWESYVRGINPQADPAAFVQDPANEHKVFGCDLWVEVTGVSLSSVPTTTPTTTPPQ